MKTLRGRLIRARKEKQMTQQQVADAARMSQAAYQKLESGKAQRSKMLTSIAKVLDVDPYWLENGTGQMRQTSTETAPRSSAPSGEDEIEFFGRMDPWGSNTPLDSDEVEVPLFREVEVAGGTGRTQVIENHGAKLRFARSTLRRAGVVAECAACAYVSGPSMEPVLPDGTTVGINTTDKRIVDGKIYVIDHEGLLRVKQLYRLPGGGLRIRSFNPDKIEFPDEDLGPDWPEQVEVKGKVFWSSTLW